MTINEKAEQKKKQTYRRPCSSFGAQPGSGTDRAVDRIGGSKSRGWMRAPGVDAVQKSVARLLVGAAQAVADDINQKNKA